MKMPPQRFLKVTENVSRGSYPSLMSIKWLKDQGYRTFIYVGEGFPGREEARLVKELGISLQHVPISKINLPGSDFVDEDQLMNAHRIVNHQNGNVYIFDDDGVSSVGALSALLRFDAGWPAQSCCEEFSWLSSTSMDSLDASTLRNQLFNILNQ
tara:strand:+ start:200 stop:664 length:465 start_codon:yes stop_codon:yes gene_type:complete